MLAPAELVLHAVLFIGVAAVGLRGSRALRPADSAGIRKLLVFYLVVQAMFLALQSRVAFVSVAGLIAALSAWEVYRLCGLSVDLMALLLGGAGLVTCALTAPLELLTLCLLLVVILDFSSEIGGRLAGRTPLAPLISPRKTVEGLVVGIASSVGAAAAFAAIASLELVRVMVLCAVVVPAAIAGDLLASYGKRRRQAKDYGTVLPGQGGVLDRFDSLILSGTALFVYGWIVHLAAR